MIGAGSGDLTTVINVVLVTMGLVVIPPLGFFVKSSISANREASRNQATAATTLAQLTERIAGLQKKAEDHDSDIRELWRVARRNER